MCYILEKSNSNHCVTIIWGSGEHKWKQENRVSEEAVAFGAT